MGTHILSDGPVGRAVLYDSVTEWAFGPLFEDADDAEAFLSWLQSFHGEDPRILDEPVLKERLNEWETRRRLGSTVDEIVASEP